MTSNGAAVAIVGAGFSGTMVAAHLARRGIGSVLIESNGRAGQGTAFSTNEPVHLLNIRAHNMGAWAEEPEDFANREALAGDAFAERRHYARYLRAILDEAIDSGCARLVEDRAVGAQRDSGGWRVQLGGGDSIQADALVLATGNQAPAKLPFAQKAGDLLIDDPWGERARSAIAETAGKDFDVLVVGTSLTMVDTVLSLDSAGHRGQILAVSRRGKLPLSGAAHEVVPIEWGDLPPLKIRNLAKWLRTRSAAVGWRSAIDSLRPHSHRLWQSLPPEQRRLFLRHGRPWWDIHRHRIAPQVAERIDTLISEGRLEVAAGQIVDVKRVGDCVEVSIRRRGKSKAGPPRRFGYIFNCTGPLADIRSTQVALLRQLLADGLAEPDDLAIGFAVDDRSRAGERLWALGTLTKGRYWEMIAVPDIREQAAAVAQDIATELGQ